MISSRKSSLGVGFFIVTAALLFKDFYPIASAGFTAGVMTVDYTQIIDICGAKIQGLAQPVEGGGVGGFHIVNGLGFLTFNFSS